MKTSSGIIKIIRKGICILLGAAAAIMILCLGVLWLMSPGKIELFTDESGKELENSMAEKCFVEINGAKMGMMIKSRNLSNPVLLFVHGGPGMPEYFLTKEYPTGLENLFTVVWWDQRGAGLSYSSEIDRSTLTVDQYIDDTIAVTNYLRERFGQDRIYLMAHSWGSYFGIQAVQKAPQLYRAYIGVGQATHQCESEKLAYAYMLDFFAQNGEESTVEKLKKNPYPSAGYSKIRDSVMHRSGIGTTHEMRSVVTGIFLSSLKCREYTLREKINLWRGKLLLNQNPQLKMKDDLRKSVTKLDVPTYFFSGAYDYTVNYQMSEDYLSQLQAPVKAFYLFEKSAHSPIFEEPDRVAQIIKQDILAQTDAAAGQK